MCTSMCMSGIVHPNALHKAVFNETVLRALRLLKVNPFSTSKEMMSHRKSAAIQDIYGNSKVVLRSGIVSTVLP